VLALTASYFKEYFAKKSAERKQIKYTKYQYIITTTIKVHKAIIKRNVDTSTTITTVLLLHEATLNPSLHPYY